MKSHPGQHVVHALREHYGLTIRRLEPLAGGYIHRVWRVQSAQGPRVVKLYAGAEWSRERLRPTIEAQVHAAALGHPVPALYRARDGGRLVETAAGCMAVFAFAEGRHIQAGALTPGIVTHVGTTLARLHQALAALPVVGEPAIPEERVVRDQALALIAAAQARPQLDEWDRAAAAAAREWLDVVACHPIDPAIYGDAVVQVVHGDYYAANLLFDGQDHVSAVLDWDFAGPNRREIEVARAVVESALTPDGGLDPDRVRAFLDGYTSVQPLTRTQRQGMFGLWLNHLLISLYPWPLRYQPGAVLPEGWAALGMRRQRMLRLLAAHRFDLERWAS